MSRTPIAPQGAARLHARDLVYRPLRHLPPLFDGATFSLSDERVGLVGRNGSGKTTLARILAGELSPERGVVERAGAVGVLAQQAAFSEERVADLVTDGPALFALRRLLAGDGDEADVARVQDRWDLEEEAERALSRVGLTHLPLERPAKTLSGGEAVRARLARFLGDDGLRRGIAAVVLDEPTNHLDLAGRHAVRAFLERTPGVVVITHDRALLEVVDRIVEVDTEQAVPTLVSYGGGYAFYEAARSEQRAARERAVVDRTKALQRRRREEQATREKQDRRDARGQKAAARGGLPRILIGMRKDNADGTRQRTGRQHDDRIRAAEGSLAEARAVLRPSAGLGFVAEGAVVPAGKVVVEARGLGWTPPGGAPVLAGLDVLWRGSARVAVVGENGAGKSTLLELLAGRRTPTAGVLHVGAEGVAWLDQDLALPGEDAEDDEGPLTVLGALRAARPDLPEGPCRERLAAFLFQRDEVFRPSAVLSGGERLRLALCCALSARPPPQLLLLDEPTNHLDLQSVHHLEGVLAGWPGALVVASHDEPFLEGLALTERLSLRRP